MREQNEAIAITAGDQLVKVHAPYPVASTVANTNGRHHQLTATAPSSSTALQAASPPPRDDVHQVMDLDGFHNDGALTVSLPVEHVGKGNADEAAALRHADFAESERFDGRVLTNFEKKGLAAGRVIHDFTDRRAQTISLEFQCFTRIPVLLWRCVTLAPHVKVRMSARFAYSRASRQAETLKAPPSSNG